MRRLCTFWLFPLAVSLHNLEEAIWMPVFWRSHGWHAVNPAGFRTLAFALALLAFVVTYGAYKQNKLAIYFFAGFGMVMLLNALWHIGVTLYLRAYSPGVVTAVVVVLPITSYLLARLLRSGPDTV
jgi:hypothetical protein